jgi:hypothetical protein
MEKYTDWYTTETAKPYFSGRLPTGQSGSIISVLPNYLVTVHLLFHSLPPHIGTKVENVDYLYNKKSQPSSWDFFMLNQFRD